VISANQAYRSFVTITLAFAALPILLFALVWLPAKVRPDSWWHPLIVLPALGGLFIDRWIPKVGTGIAAVQTMALNAYAFVVLPVLAAIFVLGSQLAVVSAYVMWAVTMSYVSTSYVRKAKIARDEALDARDEALDQESDPDPPES